MAIDWLEHITEDNNEIVYPLDRINPRYECRKILPSTWLVLNWDSEGLWLNFAVLEFHCSDGNDNNILLSCVFYGEGPVGSLRECRHTYWGRDGYIFYPNRKSITAGLEALTEFFDLD